MSQNNYKVSNHGDLKIIQSSRITEPIVYQSNQSIVSGTSATTQSVSTIELTASQSTLSSYLPRSGIQVLAEIGSLHIHQVFELNDSKIASENRFSIKTYNNDSIFLASEGSNYRDRILWGSGRKFMMHVADKFHQEALTFKRDFGCHCICFPFKKQCLEVWLQSGILLGVIQEKFSITSRIFDIENERGELLYQCSVSIGSTLCMPKEFHFRILTPDQSEQVGTLTRTWNTDLSSYTMNIYFADPTFDPKIKSLFLGLAFLLEYLFFQTRSTC